MTSEIGDASAWLNSQANPDGGFGDGTSSAYETALALSALISADSTSPAIPGAEAWLYAHQFSDGSWNSDAYATAEAILALLKVGPDLSVGANEIVLSNPTPTDLEIVTVATTIRNRGVHPAANILVRVYDGDPTLGGSQLGTDMTITALAAGADTTVQVVWDTSNAGGDHALFVIADPAGAVAEPNKSNNTGIKPVHVYFPPDLLIDVADIQFIPENPQPGQSLTISVRVHNRGELPASNVSLMIYDGDPDAGGTPLLAEAFVFPTIAAYGSDVINFNVGTYFDIEGAYPVTAEVDIGGAIREISETNNKRANTVWVGVQCTSTAVTGALSLLGMPLTPNGEVTAFKALADIDSGLEVHGWDPVSQSWRSAFALGGGPALGEDFAIGPRQGFFTRTSAGGNADFCGITAGPACVDLYAGLNLISVPYADACYSGYRLLDAVVDCVEAHAWNSVTQSWRSATKYGSTPTGDDFPVRPGVGCFIKVGSPSSWCSAYCDTNLNLPDLAIAPESFFIFPNPVSSGGFVNIWVSIANAGAVPVTDPRLDLYVGNPAAGGMRLAWFNVPETIPAGGTSGYWGNTFPISGSGAVEIWAVVDYLDELPELDETNNGAYTVLYFLSAITGAPSETPPIAQSALSATAPRRLTDAQAPPRPVVSKPVATPPGQAATATTAAKQNPEPAKAIAHVITANVSSTAATVCWTTDTCSDGRIVYGPTSSLGNLAVEDVICTDVHLVEITGLLPATTYSYAINSGDLQDDNGGALYSFTTTAVGAGIPGVVTGSVYAEVISMPLAGTLVVAELTHSGITSMPLATRSDLSGDWLLNLGNFKAAGSGTPLPWAAGDQLSIRFAKPNYYFGALDVVLSGTTPQDLGTMAAAGVHDAVEDVPSRPYLAANFPNPFNPSTTIGFGLTHECAVELAVYDVTGRRIATLVQSTYPAGRHAVVWPGSDDSGRKVASGLYFFRLRSDEIDEIRKMMLLK